MSRLSSLNSRSKTDSSRVLFGRTGTEASLHKAIEVARRQKAKSWQLRAATSLARLWKARGETEEPRQMLGDVYAWFTEGFDTPDLQDAKALLERLQ